MPKQVLVNVLPGVEVRDQGDGVNSLVCRLDAQALLDLRAQIDAALETQTLSADNDTVSQGYYLATTLHAVDADLASGNIKADIVIFGIAGSTDVRDSTDANAAVTDVKASKTFYAGGGAQKTGTLPTVALDPAADVYPAGYHAGNTSLHAVEADLVRGNIKAGINIFGVDGKTEVVDTTEVGNPVVAAR